jgi:hypothetical protein
MTANRASRAPLAAARIAQAIRRDPDFPGQVYAASDPMEPDDGIFQVTVDGRGYWVTVRECAA